ncbi:MAG: anhydro-N-acetylmuramic acid kinase [Burkholderiales bacterium]
MNGGGALAAPGALQQAELFIGLMSGTSLDGVDGVLVGFSSADKKPCVLAHVGQAFDASLKAELLALNAPVENELHRAALAANALAEAYAAVVQSLLSQTHTPAARVIAIGAHGQTVRHRPGAFDGVGYTLQLNNPALLAERSGICVASDFRSRDVAAGGQGAPLVPAFHRTWFAQPDRDLAVLNLGGIANLSLLGSDGSARGFDCGPGNGLLDHWCQRHLQQPFDSEGAWATSGAVCQALLIDLLAEPFFDLPPPKSTGRDLFNAQWLNAKLAAHTDVRANDVQATLAELTARSSAQALQKNAPDTRRLIVCGGGAYNCDLLTRLRQQLHGVVVETSDAYGLPPSQVEATAFAWLARQRINGTPIDLSAVTGARGNRVLGALYPA